MKESVEYFFFRLLQRIARHLSYATASRLGSTLGAVALALGIRRTITLDNLNRAFPEQDPAAVRRIAAGAYRNYGTALMQMLWSMNAAADELVAVVHLRDEGVFRQALARGKGVILLSGHFGSWELIVSSISLALKMPFVVIAQTQRNRKINRFVNTLRSRFGSTMVPMGPSVRQVMRALKEGKAVAMLGDQSGPKESVFVEFFGRPSATHRGAAAFSLKSETPIVMYMLVRREDGSYDVFFEEVDRSGLDGYSEENVLELTRRHTAILEKYIRRHPDHWLWMHKRWKHTPYFETHRDALTTSGRLEDAPS
jgi:KDO2-lipid IV(A) lauroyltransferase